MKRYVLAIQCNKKTLDKLEEVIQYALDPDNKSYKLYEGFVSSVSSNIQAATFFKRRWVNYIRKRIKKNGVSRDDWIKSWSWK